MVSANLAKELQNVLPKCNPLASQFCYDRSTYPSIRRLLAMSLYFLFFLCVFVVNRIVFGFAFSAARSHISAATTPQYAQRRIHPTNPLHLCHFSGISRSSRRAKMTIQRLAPSKPPAISADELHNLRILRIKNESVPTLISIFSLYFLALFASWRLIAFSNSEHS